MTQESTTGAGRMGEQPLPVFIDAGEIVRLLRMRCAEWGGNGDAEMGAKKLNVAIDKRDCR